MTMIRLTDKPLVWQRWNVHIEAGRYADNDRVALALVMAETNTEREEFAGELVAKATCNLPDEQLAADEIFVKDYSENEGMANFLVGADIIEPYPETRAESGHVEVYSYRLTMPVLSKLGLLRTVEYLIRAQIRAGKEAPSNKAIGSALEVGTEDPDAVEQFTVHDVPEPTAEIEAMQNALDALLLAYAKSEAVGDGGSVDWSDVDEAFDQAKKLRPGKYEALVRELGGDA